MDGFHHHERTNADWLRELTNEDCSQDEALKDLRQILLRAARKTVSRCLHDLQPYPREAINSLSEDCAQEALISVLAHLPEFHGDSQFTTWAYQFAVNISLAASRRERPALIAWWLDEQEPDFDEWVIVREDRISANPELPALKEEIRKIIRSVIQTDLTHRQQEALKLMVFDEAPMEEIVARMHANRNSIYKLIHEARIKIKRQLLARGIASAEVLFLFGLEE